MYVSENHFFAHVVLGADNQRGEEQAALYAVAIHESGHAAAYWTQKLELPLATRLLVGPDGQGHWYGEFQYPAPRDPTMDIKEDLKAGVRATIVCALAGREAELMLTGTAARPNFDLEQIEELVHAHDLFPAGDWWSGLLSLRWEAREIVRQHRTAIERLAAALADQRELVGAEIQELLDSVKQTETEAA